MGIKVTWEVIRWFYSRKISIWQLSVGMGTRKFIHEHEHDHKHDNDTDKDTDIEMDVDTKNPEDVYKKNL